MIRRVGLGQLVLPNIPNVSILSISIAIMIALFLWAWRLKQQLSGMTSELKQSEKKYQKIFNSVVDSFIIFDAQGNIADVNWQAQKSFGYPYEEFIKLSWKDLFPPDSHHLFEQFRFDVVSRGFSSSELANVRKDGSTFIVDMKGSIYEDHGQPHILTVIREITEQKKIEKRIRYMITHDTLTGLYNRTLFEEEVIKLERNRTFPVSIIIVDVDGLKKTNDTQGHATGDDLLRRAAKVLKLSFRSNDIVARIGGDEFAILLPEADANKAREAIIRIKDNVSDHNKKYQTLPVSLSYGAATGYQGNSLSQIFKDADKQMYENKISKVTGLSKADALVSNPAG
jgi:diguanylate cyclase (GGDEF)-like protein/PAS domain S-box-containing protein